MQYTHKGENLMIRIYIDRKLVCKNLEGLLVLT